MTAHIDCAKRARMVNGLKSALLSSHGVDADVSDSEVPVLWAYVDTDEGRRDTLWVGAGVTATGEYEVWTTVRRSRRGEELHPNAEAVHRRVTAALQVLGDARWRSKPSGKSHGVIASLACRGAAADAVRLLHAMLTAAAGTAEP